MAKADNQFGPLGAHLIHHVLHVFIANPERIFGEHPAGVGNRHIGKGLTDHRNLGATTFEHLVRWEQFGGFVPFSVKNVLAKGREGQVFDNFLNPVAAECEFPMEGHRVRLQGIHDIDHVLTRRLVAGVRPMPCVPAIKQNCVRPVSADRLDDCCHTVQSTDPAVGLCKR